MVRATETDRAFFNITTPKAKRNSPTKKRVHHILYPNVFMEMAAATCKAPLNKTHIAISRDNSKATISGFSINKRPNNKVNIPTEIRKFRSAPPFLFIRPAASMTTPGMRITIPR